MIAFLAVCIVSYLVSDYRYSSQIELVRVVLYAGLLYAVVGSLDVKGLTGLLQWVVLIGVVESVWCLVQFYFLSAIRGKGTFFSPNLTATYLVGCIAVCVGHGLAGRDRSSFRWLWALAGAMSLWAVATTGSRSALLSLAVLLGAMLGLRRTGRRWLLAGAGILVLLVLVPNPVRDRVLFSRSEDIYAVQRPQIWLQSLKILVDHPILGATLGNFEYVSSRYQFPVEDAVARYAKTFATADNGFLEIAAETGVPGAVCLGWCAALVIGLFRKGRAAVTGTADEPHFLAAFLAIVVLASQALFHKVYHSPPSVVMGIVALSLVARAAGMDGIGEGGKIRTGAGVGGWTTPRGRLRPAVCLGGVVVILVAIWPYFCLAPFLAYSHYERAARLQTKGDLYGAQQELKQAILYNPKQAFFHHRLGNVAMERSSVDQSERATKAAWEAFTTAVRTNPIHFTFHHTLARYHEFMVPLVQGRERDEHILAAAAAYERAIELAPTNPFLYVGLAALHIKAGNLDQALEPLQGALALEPNFVTARVLSIDVNERLGRGAEASRFRNELQEIARRLSNHRPVNGYEAKLLMEPARYFKEEG